MQIALITGISGSGKTVGLNVLEDAGFYCVDNLPPSLLCALVETQAAQGTRRLAVAIDARSADSLADLPDAIRRLRDASHDVKMVFLTAKTEALIPRFSETRRSHPLTHRLLPGQNPNTSLTLAECIRMERGMMVEIEGMAQVIDTSGLSPNTLRTWIKDLVGGENATLTLLFESFAFKYGVPLDADFVFDVRMLTNPYYNTELRPLTGRDAPVMAFLKTLPEACELLADMRGFIEKWLPSFKGDNRSYLTVAIGCTGGQHRSVYMVEQLANYFQSAGEHVVRRHRELN